ncbi:hypothetical protein CANINC_000938 [Pichia inconspicua]|uniref:Uncharacterized protein n=1 Tax=Pichia inconspicua TaxID=52247 RepID=A0A4T0X5Y2_9ASCO|nr:hypothetical protein CANINC_000938 [[Candida] inconspicua]
MARLNFLGYVISQGKMEKTIKVRVLQKKFDKRVQKHFLQKKDYLVHDEGEVCREGDLVRIEQTRPFSATKFFAVAEIKKNKGQQFAEYQKQSKLAVKSEETEKLTNLRTKISSSNKSNIYDDVNFIRSIENKDNLNDDEISRVNEIRERYSLDELKKEKLLKTSLSSLSDSLQNLEKEIKLAETLDKVINDNETEKLHDVFERLKIDETTPRNIKKNKLRKFLLNSDVKELQNLGIKL